MTQNSSSDSNFDATQKFMEAFIKAVGGDTGHLAFKIITELGRNLLVPYVIQSANSSKSSEEINLSRPFAIVGMGRCGTRVTAEVAEMVAKAQELASEAGRKDQTMMSKIAGPIRNLLMFLSSQQGQYLAMDPIMVLGDVDETTYDVAKEIIIGEGNSEYRQKIFNNCLKIDYSSLTVGGAGHFPLVAEFLTSCLLSQPPDKSWEEAHKYLLNVSTHQIADSLVSGPRLVFYIFSAGGGTGAGAAPLVMSSQRLAAAMLGRADNPTYHASMAVFPDDIYENEQYKINSGRTVIRYLGSLKIDITSKSAYSQPQQCLGDGISDTGTSKPVLRLFPWDSLAIISNRVMHASSSDGMSVRDVEKKSNHYIAQQIFNLAASQLPIGKAEQSSLETEMRVDSISLDPADLRNALSGPIAICYSEAKSQQIASQRDVDLLFLRAIDFPATYDDIPQIIQGISVPPVDDDEIDAYKNEMSLLRDKSRESPDGKAVLTVTDFENVSKHQIFNKCSRWVVVITSPVDWPIKDFVAKRIIYLVKCLLRKQIFGRVAIIRGTSPNITLSVYLEGSVLFSPDVTHAFMSYLKLGWKQRATPTAQFEE